MYKIFSAFILLFALNCKSTDNQAKTNQEVLVEIKKGNLYGSGEEGIEKQNLVIDNVSDWQNLLTKMNSVNKVSDGFIETKIDFEKYLIIAVFDDVKTTGGHVVELKIDSKDEEIVVNVESKSPEGMATTVMTQPYCIVRIEKTDKPINFQF